VIRLPITPEQAAQITTRLADELAGRHANIKENLDYFKGDCGKLRFASDEFNEHFNKRFEGFADNWCKPVIVAPAERIKLKGIRLDGQGEADADLKRVMQVNEYETGFSEALVLTLAAKRSLALVWGNDDDPDTPEVTFEHPEQAIVAYEPGSRRRKYGLKMWSDADEGYDYATLYTPDEVWKFQKRASAKTIQLPSGVTFGGWEARFVATDDTWPLKNPLGVVPLVELPNQSLLKPEPMSDLGGVKKMQDAINLAWAYLFNDLDFMSLPQRMLLGGEIPEVPILDANGQDTGQRRKLDMKELMAERILWVPSKPGSDVKSGEWTAAAGDSFLQVINQAVEHVAAQTRTPPHYLIAKMVNTAAEALTVAEAGLVSRTDERITYITPGVREIFRLICLAQGDEGRADAVRSGTLLWGDIQYRSEAQRADALMKKRQMGYPLEYLLELDGVDPLDIPRIMEMVEREKKDAQLEEVTRALAMRDAMGEPQESDGEEDAAGDSDER